MGYDEKKLKSLHSKMEKIAKHVASVDSKRSLQTQSIIESKVQCKPVDSRDQAEQH